jgi:hypothetical protein
MYGFHAQVKYSSAPFVTFPVPVSDFNDKVTQQIMEYTATTHTKTCFL